MNLQHKANLAAQQHRSVYGANIRLKMPASGTYPNGQPEATARWAINQALNGWTHIVTRLDVIAIAAGIVQRDGLAITFGPD